jgi:hypothetical protein
LIPEAQGQTLFPKVEIVGGVFGETANGNVSEQTYQSVVETTTKVTTTPKAVEAPTVPVPPTVITDGIKPAIGFPTTHAAAQSPTTQIITSQHIVLHHQFNYDDGGGGVQLGYFFTRYTGIMVDAAFLGGSLYQTVVTGDFILRDPFEFGSKTTETSGYSKDGKETLPPTTTTSEPTWGLAPYIIAGGGGQWGGTAVAIADVGAGVEFRFRSHYGFFVESRWFVHDDHRSYIGTSAGITYGF